MLFSYHISLMGGDRILGGLYILGPGDKGVHYEWIEQKAGDKTNPDEIVDICRKIKKDLDGSN